MYLEVPTWPPSSENSDNFSIIIIACILNTAFTSLHFHTWFLSTVLLYSSRSKHSACTCISPRPRSKWWCHRRSLPRQACLAPYCTCTGCRPCVFPPPSTWGLHRRDLGGRCTLWGNGTSPRLWHAPSWSWYMSPVHMDSAERYEKIFTVRESYLKS